MIVHRKHFFSGGGEVASRHACNVALLYKRDILSLYKLFISQCLIPARNFCFKKNKNKKSLANHICTGEDNSKRNVIVSV